MKRLLLILLTAAGLAILAPAATITLSGPTSPTGAFDVNVNATNVFANFPGEAVTGFGFNVTISSPVVSFLGVTVNGTFFDDLSGCCTGTDVDALTNVSFPAGVSAGDFSEPLLLATLHFSVTGSGPTTIGVTADSSNPDEGLFFLSGSESFSASQQITAGAVATPEPTTVCTAGLGIVGLALLRRRGNFPQPHAKTKSGRRQVRV